MKEAVIDHTLSRSVYGIGNIYSLQINYQTHYGAYNNDDDDDNDNDDECCEIRMLTRPFGKLLTGNGYAASVRPDTNTSVSST